ncbi:C-type lectin-related protein 4 [Plakobranchus ocellatus]|uniref:C-type lectin-related protein 4 n=1 Tax=Plakobranchus ocellatus TaxID=259542 RepID=A0AAV4A9L4_9GAST|nr:C-type lectin-related protein 4 [Plakobranchus ocellatus]
MKRGAMAHLVKQLATKSEIWVENESLFSLLSADIVSNIPYGVSTSGWTGVSTTAACALRTVTTCRLARGFVFESAPGQCKPVLWLHQGSGGTVVPAGSVDTHLVNMFLRNQLDEFCQAGFEAVKFGNEGHFTCLLELTSLSTYQKASTECKALGGYLASVRTAEKLEVARAFAKGSSVWVGLDDLVAEGVYIWQENDARLTATELDAVFGQYPPDNGAGGQHCGRYSAATNTLDDYFCTEVQKALCETPPLSGLC